MAIIKKFKDFSIKNKFIMIIMLTSGIVLIIASSSFLLKDMMSIRSNTVEKLTSVTKVIGTNSTAALAFEDQGAAGETLEALSAEPNISAAHLYDKEGKVFASYYKQDYPAHSYHTSELGNHDYTNHRKELPPQWLNKTMFWDDHIDIFQDILLDGERIGAINLEYDLKEIKNQKYYFIGIGIAVLLLSLLFAYLIASKLHSIITRPISVLTKTMKSISKDRIYSVRVSKHSNDEIGILIDGFNDMLAQIESRDEELEKHSEQLEGAVATRTAELMHATERAQLMAKQAEAANVAKSAFLANMSHELRTPLNAIIGFSEVLIDKHFGELNEQQEDYQNDILNSGRHLLSLVQDILDLSKVEAGKMELDLGSASVNELLQGSLVMIKEKALKHGIKISVETDDIPELVMLDERKIKQIVFNLLSNSIKFTPDGGSIGIHAEVIDREWIQTHVPGTFSDESTSIMEDNHRSYVKISVTDTGIGIESNSIKRVLEPFQQEDTSTSRRFGGTGLGLSMCKKLVELHNGMLWVESTVGKGSTFSFVIPIMEEYEHASDEQVQFQEDNAPSPMNDDNAELKDLVKDNYSGY